jgi:nicotinate phosphoribosyltransferase
VKFKVIIRDPTIPVGMFVDKEELRNSLDYARTLKMRKTDLYYLRGIDLFDRYMFQEDYLKFLETLQLPPYRLVHTDDAIELSFEGPWESVTMWETIALSIISQLYYRGVFKKTIPARDHRLVYDAAHAKLEHKLRTLSDHPRIRFADFSGRRRHSFLWQDHVVKTARRMFGDRFTGTSGVYMAFKHDLTPIGTYAHEPPMVMTALAGTEEEMRYAQYKFLEEWQEVYKKGLRLILPDTYGSAQFFANAPSWLLKWDAQRQDSGVPIEEGERYIAWLEKGGEDPAKHWTVFSDGLDVRSMVEIDSHFADRHAHPYGWGSLLGNDFIGTYDNPYLRPISMVCKVVEAEGRPVVKLPNNLRKATGPREEIERYLRIFGREGRGEQEVIV